MKKLIVIPLLILMTTGVVFAQSVPGGFQSPQSHATQGRIRSAADDFIRPDSYASAKVDDWFAMTSFESDKKLHLGIAKNLDNLYLAAYYGGSFWAGAGSFSYTERTMLWVDNTNKNVPVYGDLVISNKPDNRVSVLLGMGDIGMRLSFYSNYKSFGEKDFYSSTTSSFYKDYKTADGTISGQLAFSYNKNILSNGIKPWATLDMGFQKAYKKYDEYLNDGTTNSKGVIVEDSQNYFAPELRIGLGGYTVIDRESGFRGSVDLEYRLLFRTYKNDYYYWDGSAYKTDKIKGLNTAGDLTENKYIQNTIIPTFSGSLNIGTLALRGRLGLQMTLNNTGKTGMDFDGTTSGRIVKEGADEKTFYFDFRPQLQLAVQWRIIPMLALNAGGLIDVQAVRRTVTKSENYVQNNKVGSSDKAVKYETGSTNNWLTLGFTLNATPNLVIEGTSGFSKSTSAIASENIVSVFDPSGLFRFASILVHLKL